jgi:pimeloyl-ACP methyl ester carboxylesterase
VLAGRWLVNAGSLKAVIVRREQAVLEREGKLVPAAVRFCLAVLSSCALIATAHADYLVREVGSFHIGGREVVLSGLPEKELSYSAGMASRKIDPNGEFEAGQMYVQYVKLANPKAKYPLLLWHGGGLTGVTWETKPDGKPGWQQFFLSAGYDTYVSDAVERGRASWARYPEIFKTEPVFRTKKEAWELFRIGPSYETGRKRVAYDDVQFPVEAFDQLAKQIVPRWTTTDALTQAAYDALVQKLCPCIIVVHSQGGNFGFRATLAAPGKVKALVAVEPSSALDPAQVDATKLKGVPHLFVWGDHLDGNKLYQNFFMKAPQLYFAALKEAGVDAFWLDLPKEGIKGNSHMMMMDKNSDEIAKRIQSWFAEHGLEAS